MEDDNPVFTLIAVQMDDITLVEKYFSRRIHRTRRIKDEKNKKW